MMRKEESHMFLVNPIHPDCVPVSLLGTNIYLYGTRCFIMHTPMACLLCVPYGWSFQKKRNSLASTMSLWLGIVYLSNQLHHQVWPRHPWTFLVERHKDGMTRYHTLSTLVVQLSLYLHLLTLYQCIKGVALLCKFWFLVLYFLFYNCHYDHNIGTTCRSLSRFAFNLTSRAVRRFAKSIVHCKKKPRVV